MAVSTGSIPTLGKESYEETLSTPFATLNSNAKVVSVDPDNPAGETGAAHIILELQPPRKCTFLHLREKSAGAKSTGAIVTVYGRFDNQATGASVWRELYQADGTSSIDFGTTYAMADGSFNYSAMKSVDTLGAHAVLVLVTNASDAATSSIIEGHLVGPS